MSWTQPSSAIRQQDDREGTNSNGTPSRTFAFKAPYADLHTAMAALVAGDIIEEGWRASSWVLSRIPGEWAKLEITCAPNDTTGGSTPTQTALKERWSIKSVRNDMSILGYCAETYPDGRISIEMWMKETDDALATGFQYRNPQTGDVETLGTEAKNVAKKISKGVESVMRFYPILTRTRIYSSPPADVLQNLAHIDTPAAGIGDNVKAPGNLSTIISLHQWVKCQDDCEEDQSGNWIRVESWMGMVKNNTVEVVSDPWDKNLYGNGNDRWPIPYVVT